jgi:predicted nucleotidyltransferase component of viral defense system
LVVKGGFAIRHLYSGVRYSKDADLTMASDELELEGPQLMSWPSDMTVQENVAQGMASWILSIRFRRTDGRRQSTQCDLNDRSRALRRRPPQQRELSSIYMPPFMVWAATTEEIIGEKLYALIDHQAIRIKDVFDLRHLLGLRHERIDGAAACGIYTACREAKGNRGPAITGDVAGAIRAIASTGLAAQQWQNDVVDFVGKDAPTLADATDEMISLLDERVLSV